MAYVDSLCITQNNEREIEVYVPEMRNIYSSALLTIVAGAGDSVHAGLPGIQSDREEQLSATLGDFSLLTRTSNLCKNLGGPFHSTVWNTRASTFQEQLLSHRLLTFLKGQAYWQCNKSEWLEDMDLDGLNQHIAWENGVQQSRLELTMYNFGQLVELYTRRHLTHDSDIDKAFGGILAAIPDQFIWALPSTQFVEHLCWHSDVAKTSPLLRRRLKPLTPSWPWLGWKGWIMMEQIGGTKPKPLISCYRLKESIFQCVNPSLHQRAVRIADVPLHTTLNDGQILFWAEIVRLGVRGQVAERVMDICGYDDNVGVGQDVVRELTSDTENVPEDESVHNFVVIAGLSGGYLVLMLSWHEGIARRGAWDVSEGLNTEASNGKRLW